MADAFETGDPAYIAKALGVVARAKVMSQIAQDTGLSREQLYRSFSDQGNPTLQMDDRHLSGGNGIVISLYRL